MSVLLSPTLLALLQPAQDTASLHRFKVGVPPAPPPIPDPVVSVLRTIFNAPLWMWVAGLLVVVAGGVVVLRLLWTRRQAIREWVVTRNRGVKLAVVATAGVILAVLALGGTVSWNYMQHENAFCSGCHIMEGPWNKFALDAGKHSKLQCHDCHQQSLYASTRQLVLWVANRPEKIPPHSPVPDGRCEACHAVNQSEKWTRIKETAGHRTHLESDSTALDKVQCVTCHGADVHEFLPAKETCGQSGCHDQTEIRLGKMAAQTALHCNQCHQFTAEVPRLATRDSAAGTLRPASPQCLACHEMKIVLADFDADKEPHSAVCGTCHNPHTQETPQAAGKTCVEAQCHSNWRGTPFHVGTSHRRVGEQCLTCHTAHAARLDASDCVACHTKITRRAGSRLRPPLPFDTARALRPPALLDSRLEEPVRGKGDVPPPDLPPAVLPAVLPPARADSFPHARHTRLACITCHASGTQHGRLTFEAPRGCQICHHQRPQQSNCATCHTPTERAQPVPLTIDIAIRDSAARSRPVGFAHPVHDRLRCVQCHTEPVTLAPAASARACRDCHGDHHAAGRTCATCHTGARLRTAHSRDLSLSHQKCDACHNASTVALLTPDRSFCLTCHQPQRDHYVRGQCTTCHFLKPPAEFRSHLLGGRRG
jgi:nitrate/TMAO reductase-like tetraheme cytochrome c subunit